MTNTRPIVSMATWKAEADLIGALFSDIETGVAGPQFWPAMTAYVDALADEQARKAGQDAGNG